MVLSLNRVFGLIFLIGATLSLFTSLRFSFFGLGELLIIFSFFLTNYSKIPAINFKNYPFTFFWFVYISSSLIGAFINLTILENQTGTISKLSLDLFAYIFIFCTSFTLETNFNQGSINPWRTLKYFILATSSILTLLLFISFFTPSLFGLNLMYHTNFSPLVDNVHQISMFYVLLPFLCLGIFLKEQEMNLGSRTSFEKVLFFLLVCSTLYMATTATATKAIVGFWLGVACFVIFYLISKTNIYLKSLIVYLILIGASFVFFYFDVYRSLTMFFNAADLGGGRAFLYSASINLISDSPIFGRGPGGHIWMGRIYWDVHQSFFTIFLQAGIIGFLMFFVLIFRFVKEIYRESIFLASMVPLLIYALGGDILRRLPVWIILIFVMYAIKHLHSNSDSETKI